MFPEEAPSLGGKATAIKLRREAIEKYYKNPNRCLQCDSIIHIGDKKVSEIRKKKFCNHNCSAIYSNTRRIRKKKIKPIKVKIAKFNYLKNLTKEELFEKRKNWQSARTSIRNHAGHIYKNDNSSYICQNCGYDKHVEICHIKPVSDFPGDTLITDINAKENLIGLCPNCHWEFDNGKLNIAAIKAGDDAYSVS